MERDCITCKFEYLGGFQDPCRKCFEYSLWVDKSLDLKTARAMRQCLTERNAITTAQTALSMLIRTLEERDGT